MPKEKRSDFGFDDKFLFGSTKDSIIRSGPSKKRRKGKKKKKR